jgi:hypothetical protein
MQQQDMRLDWQDGRSRAAASLMAAAEKAACGSTRRGRARALQQPRRTALAHAGSLGQYSSVSEWRCAAFGSTSTHAAELEQQSWSSASTTQLERPAQPGSQRSSCREMAGLPAKYC